MISELSEAGMTCVSGATVQLGEEFTAVWRLREDDSPLQVICAVRDIAPDRTGVEFLNLTLADRLRIASFIATRMSRNVLET